MKILIGVSGGIAAYKACELCSLALKQGHDVRVVMTKNACRFVAPLTFEGLCGTPALTDEFATAMSHIKWAKWADIGCVAPLTANTLAKITHGLADDALTTVFSALPREIPQLLCPAMNTEMWRHPATQRNLRILSEFSNFYLEPPVEKRLACGDFGMGGLAEVTKILARCEALGAKDED
jgi:phosphopantothenoylcysteine synthetase/decarboxylase